MNRKPSIILLFLAILFLATSTARPSPRKASESQLSYVNASSPEFQQDGAFAVAEYNKGTTKHLEFITVLNASRLIVYDPYIWRPYNVTYVTFLVIEAKNCSQPDQVGLYRTDVYEIFSKGGPAQSQPLTLNRFQLTNSTAGDPF